MNQNIIVFPILAQLNIEVVQYLSQSLNPIVEYAVLGNHKFPVTNEAQLSVRGYAHITSFPLPFIGWYEISQSRVDSGNHTTKLQLLVNVWIVFHPDDVMVQPVAIGSHT